MVDSRETAVDWTRVYDGLSDAVRREVVRYLSYTAATADVEEVATHLLNERHDGCLPDGDETDRDMSILTAGLYHVHLPKLDEAGLVAWHSGERTVALTTLAYRLPVGILAPGAADRPNVPVVGGTSD